MTDDNDVYTPAQFREHQDGFGVRDADAHRHTGIVRDEKVSRYLSILAENYDPTEAEGEMPGTVDELDEVEQIRSIAATETAREALDTGDMPTLKHLTGDQQQRADVSGMKAIEQLRGAVTGPAPMFYIWAEPGAGKTNFAFLLAQLWKQAHDGDAVVASNVRTLMESDPWPGGDRDGRAPLPDDVEPESRDGWIPNFETLTEWIEQDGTPPRNHDQRPKLFIFDEASSSAGGSGNSGFHTKAKMGPLAYKIRKFGGALIVIGHDGKDVHPLIRELGVAIKKDAQKDATFYDDVRNRDGVGERFAVTGIPETDWRYDDGEATAWSWSSGSDDDDGEPTAEDMATWTAIRCKEQGMTGGEVAEYIPYSRSWVDTRYREYRDKSKYSETLARVEDEIA